MKAATPSQAQTLEQVPNIGKAIADDLRTIGIAEPQALCGQDPYALYEHLNQATGQRQDPCVLDTFIAAVRFMDGGPPLPWWSYTAERKRHLLDKVQI
jgi:DNA transformation protein